MIGLLRVATGRAQCKLCGDKIEKNILAIYITNGNKGVHSVSGYIHSTINDCNKEVITKQLKNLKEFNNGK